MGLTQARPNEHEHCSYLFCLCSHSSADYVHGPLLDISLSMAALDLGFLYLDIMLVAPHRSCIMSKNEQTKDGAR